MKVGGERMHGSKESEKKPKESRGKGRADKY
jgi:hypothetical protein